MFVGYKHSCEHVIRKNYEIVLIYQMKNLSKVDKNLLKYLDLLKLFVQNRKEAE